MKVFVISKKTLIYALTAAVVLIAAILVAVIAGKGAKTETEELAQTSEKSKPVMAGPIVKHETAKVNFEKVEEYEVEVMAGLMKELPIYSVQRADKKIALTIDAAWQDDKTPFILETLKKYNIHATFFLCGFWVEAYPDMVRLIAADGHEIGNHSMTHPHMSKLSDDQIENELDKFENLIEPLTGKKTKLFRAPFGEYNDNVIKALRRRGYEVIQWNIDTIDWKQERSAQTILDTVLPKLSDGSIILCHNNGYKIEQYLPTLIESALAQGYEFVTISELLLGGSTVIDVNGVQKPLE